MYVITGATGNTGSVVAETLLAKGEKVRVIGRNAERLGRFTKKGAEAFVADVEDAAALARAFSGARAVYAMIPPNLSTPEQRDYQERVSDSLAAAIEKAGVSHSVCLSSFGADKAERVGPVAGLHSLEQKLNRISNLNALHLRAGWFMENHFAQIGVIKKMGVMGGALRTDLLIPQIATRDIGKVAAEALQRLDFTGKQTRELLGQRDLSMAETAKAIGKAIDRPTLGYSEIPYSQFEQTLQQMGLPAKTAKLFNEMVEAINTGWMAPLEKRSAHNTTPTSIESFAAEKFAPRFRGEAAAAS